MKIIWDAGVGNSNQKILRRHKFIRLKSMTDPRISLPFAGLLLLVVSILYPVDIDRIQMLTNNLQDLNKQLDLCKDPQCQKNIENLMSNAQVLLNYAEIPGQTKAIFLIGGIIAEVGFVISLKF